MSLFMKLADKGLRASSLGQASVAVSWVAQVAGREDLAKDRMVMSIISSVCRPGDGVSCAKPVTKEHLLFFYHWAQQRGTFVPAGTFVMSLSFLYFCARFNDIAFLCWKDVEMQDDCIHITMQETKTDQYRQEGNITFMPCVNDPRLCLVCALNEWRKWLQVGTGAGNALFLTAYDTNKPTPILPIVTI